MPLREEYAKPSRTAPFIDALQDMLWDDHRIEVPVMLRPSAPRRVIRVAAQLYNSEEQYGRLVDAPAQAEPNP